MSKTVLWFIFSCKRQMKRPFFVVLLVLLPILLLGFRRVEQKDTQGIFVAVYMEGKDDPFLGEVADKLEEEGGAFHFYVCESEEQLLDDVASRKAECGYLFPEDMEERLDSGKYRNSIRLISAPSTVAAKLSTEVVFARMFKVYGKELLKDYAAESEIFVEMTPEEVWKQLEPLYEKYTQNGSTFTFSYQTEGGSAKEIQRETTKMAFPVRGIVAVYIFVVGLFSAVMLCEDEQKGLFLPVSYGSRLWCGAASMAAPVFLSALSGLAAIWITGGGIGFLKEAGLMAVYICAVTVFSYLLKRMVRQPMALCSLIPLLTIASFLVCPVFVDLSSFVPVLKTIRYGFLPYYYLSGFGIFS